MLVDSEHPLQLAVVGVLETEPDHSVQHQDKWALTSRQMAALGAANYPESDTLHLPLIAARGAVGVLNLRPRDPIHALSSEQSHLLRTFANQTALAIERARLAEEAQQARVQIETERLRNALLSSVSHDLRTPLTAITGATTLLLDDAETIDSATRHDLIQSVYEEADRLNRLENASKYAPPASPIDIAAHVSGTDLVLEVSDSGPGILPGDHARIFEEFYRARQYRAEASGRERGVGLGLTICRGIIDAHGGRMWVEDRPAGGAMFCFTLPLGSRPPEVEALARNQDEREQTLGGYCHDRREQNARRYHSAD